MYVCLLLISTQLGFEAIPIKMHLISVEVQLTSLMACIPDLLSLSDNMAKAAISFLQCRLREFRNNEHNVLNHTLFCGTLCEKWTFPNLSICAKHTVQVHTVKGICFCKTWHQLQTATVITWTLELLRFTYHTRNILRLRKDTDLTVPVEACAINHNKSHDLNVSKCRRCLQTVGCSVR